MLSTTAITFGSFLTAWLATAALVRLLGRRLLDVPNQRSCHRTPTPRGGGLGVSAGLAAGLLTAWVLEGAAPGLYLLLGAAAIAVCGWLDDVRHLRPAVRLTVQLAAAVTLLSGTGPLERLPLPVPLNLPLGWAAIPLSVLWLVGAVNIYNFLDGIDGFAGLQGVIAGLAVACMRFDGGSRALGLALAGAAAGFLIHNWHPARIFLGDVGSTTIGFLLAGLPFQLDRAAQPTAVLCVALCTWFFLVDGALTLLRRLVRRQRIWEAHREHLYQQLVLRGLPPNFVVARVGAMAVAVSGLAVLAVRTGRTELYWGALLLAATEFLLYLRWVKRQRSIEEPVWIA